MIWASLLAIALADPAAACPDGKVPTDGGACCWPEQRHDGLACFGPPTCPEGLVRSGYGCVGPEHLGMDRIQDTIVEDGRTRACFGKAFVKQAEVPSKVELRFQILPDGRTAELTVTQTGEASPALEPCLREVFADLTFPAGDRPGPIDVTYPFLLN